MKLEERLTALRKKKGLSQLELAETLGVSRQAVSRWEVGASAPGMENLLAWLYWGRHSAPPADRTEEGIPIIDIEDMEGERIDDSDVVIIGETS